MSESMSRPQRLRSVIVARGFHGTTVTRAEELLISPLRLHVSRNVYDWLGDGMYFWQDAPERAWAWAVEHAQRRSDPQPAVVGALLEFDATNSLDLLDMRAVRIVVGAYSALERSAAAAGRPLPSNRPSGRRELDQEVINLAARMLEEATPGLRIAVVRGAFQEGAEVYPGAGFWTLSHVQIALRDEAALTDRWRVR